MDYLTFSEYEALKLSDIEEDDFDRLVPRASDVVDSHTRYYYKFHELENDEVIFRKTQFKKAIALQIEHMHLIDAVASVEVDSPMAWSMDGVSMSTGNSSAAYEKTKTSLVSQDALDQLAMTGLLYKGV